jgi:hypothetical protein
VRIRKRLDVLLPTYRKSVLLGNPFPHFKNYLVASSS